MMANRDYIEKNNDDGIEWRSCDTIYWQNNRFVELYVTVLQSKLYNTFERV